MWIILGFFWWLGIWVLYMILRGILCLMLAIGKAISKATGWNEENVISFIIVLAAIGVTTFFVVGSIWGF